MFDFDRNELRQIIEERYDEDDFIDRRSKEKMLEDFDAMTDEQVIEIASNSRARVSRLFDDD